MKAILIIFSFLVATNVYSQEKYISISKMGTDKISVFHENKRVRVRTVQGAKINGKLQIVDDKQVMIKNIIIPITNIEMIKLNPLALNIFITGSMLYFGLLVVGVGIVTSAFSESAIGLLYMIPGAGLIFGGIKSPNFLPKTIVENNSVIKVKTQLE